MEKRQNESCKENKSKNQKTNTEFAKELCPKEKKENKK
jgi:hypothetical protein